MATKRKKKKNKLVRGQKNLDEIRRVLARRKKPEKKQEALSTIGRWTNSAALATGISS